LALSEVQDWQRRGKPDDEGDDTASPVAEMLVETVGHTGTKAVGEVLISRNAAGRFGPAGQGGLEDEESADSSDVKERSVPERRRRGRGSLSPGFGSVTESAAGWAIPGSADELPSFRFVPLRRPLKPGSCLLRLGDAEDFEIDIPTDGKVEESTAFTLCSITVNASCCSARTSCRRRLNRRFSLTTKICMPRRVAMTTRRTGKPKHTTAPVSVEQNSLASDDAATDLGDDSDAVGAKLEPLLGCRLRSDALKGGTAMYTTSAIKDGSNQHGWSHSA
jgi:hypothetical protein